VDALLLRLQHHAINHPLQSCHFVRSNSPAQLLPRHSLMPLGHSDSQVPPSDDEQDSDSDEMERQTRRGRPRRDSLALPPRTPASKHIGMPVSGAGHFQFPVIPESSAEKTDEDTPESEGKGAGNTAVDTADTGAVGGGTKPCWGWSVYSLQAEIDRWGLTLTHEQEEDGAAGWVPGLERGNVDLEALGDGKEGRNSWGRRWSKFLQDDHISAISEIQKLGGDSGSDSPDGAGEEEPASSSARSRPQSIGKTSDQLQAAALSQSFRSSSLGRVNRLHPHPPQIRVLQPCA
jgi:hypothetical protein